jgi:epoxyqueuosine reductase
MQSASTRPSYGTCLVASIQHFPIGDLAEKGLLLQAALPIAGLDADFVRPLVAAGVDLACFKTLVLMGQAGTLLFDDVVSRYLDEPDPFDNLSLALVQEWFALNAPDSRFFVAYPGTVPLPLGRLAECAGWGKSSPLGLTIHPDYGLWVAHRVAFLTDIKWDHQDPHLAHPCDSCTGRPCEAACPVGAVSVVDGFDVRACSTHRSPVGSACEYECAARNACPVGTEFRYGSEQMRHHYESGLNSIREWLR